MINALGTGSRPEFGGAFNLETVVSCQMSRFLLGTRGRGKVITCPPPHAYQEPTIETVQYQSHITTAAYHTCMCAAAKNTIWCLFFSVSHAFNCVNMTPISTAAHTCNGHAHDYQSASVTPSREMHGHNLEIQLDTKVLTALQSSTSTIILGRPSSDFDHLGIDTTTIS